jgi:hypothetical protein
MSLVVKGLILILSILFLILSILSGLFSVRSVFSVVIILMKRQSNAANP